MSLASRNGVAFLSGRLPDHPRIDRASDALNVPRDNLDFLFQDKYSYITRTSGGRDHRERGEKVRIQDKRCLFLRQLRRQE